MNLYFCTLGPNGLRKFFNLFRTTTVRKFCSVQTSYQPRLSASTWPSCARLARSLTTTGSPHPLSWSPAGWDFNFEPWPLNFDFEVLALNFWSLKFWPWILVLELLTLKIWSQNFYLCTLTFKIWPQNCCLEYILSSKIWPKLFDL